MGVITDNSVNASKIQEAMKVASEDTIALEPDLTRWDTVSDRDWAQHALVTCTNFYLDCRRW